ncbi:TadE/TadG family type IV pilus assembly protein [Aestuariimicrobium sp. T2.26MG-19.2B]|uniref:TadE/TadG family type IV pilus assembly protein n=1 Tax=Aestuariimicrobium sp. T2.26MG-19.2B TaxID=3040679 RepID=UPI002477522D|nr:TadE/TadG family type IV pilus assembly protein [Aestuariimicrobium sp. T2.26MG-19.2B]CAI9403338.1 hypothetical protein AESSP_00984 [Aestuariimicrobium sp. T2.26MG-19.2B]
MNGRSRLARDRGMSLTVETVLLVPVFVLVLMAMVAGWRIWSVRAEVRHAAAASARAASLQPAGASARSASERVAESQLASSCDDPVVLVDTSQFGRRGGTPAEVTVRISCRVRLDDLLVPGLPGSFEATASAHSSLDRFRERRP